MAKMRYADMPRDVSIDNFPSLNVSEVIITIQFIFIKSFNTFFQLPCYGKYFPRYVHLCLDYIVKYTYLNLVFNLYCLTRMLN